MMVGVYELKKSTSQVLYEKIFFDCRKERNIIRKRLYGGNAANWKKRKNGIYAEVFTGDFSLANTDQRLLLAKYYIQKLLYPGKFYINFVG